VVLHSGAIPPTAMAAACGDNRDLKERTAKPCEAVSPF
jgi:hypothetical protein